MSFINISIQDLATLLSRRTVAQLKTTAKNMGLKIGSKMKKQQIIDIIHSDEIENRNQKQSMENQQPVEEVTISSSTDEFTEESTDEPIEVEFVNRLSRPTGVRMLGLSFVVFGILLAVASIIFGVFVMCVVILDVMGILGGIGDPSLSIPISTGGVDESMIHHLMQ